MTNAEPLEIRCPTCNQGYRFGATVPPQLVCKRCQTVMDLRAYATAHPPLISAGRRGATGSPTTGGRRRTSPSLAASKARTEWRWALAGLAAVGVGFRILQRSNKQEAAEVEQQRRLDEILNPSYETRKRRSDELQRATTENARRLMSKYMSGMDLVRLVSPQEGQKLSASPARVEGRIMLSEPGDVVTVNGTVVRVIGGVFSTDVVLNEGANTIEVVVTAGETVSRQAIQVTYRPPK